MVDKYIFQSYTLLNKAASEALGKSAVIAEDLTNMVDVGSAIIGSNKVEVFTKALTTGIVGKTISAIREYKGGKVPNVLRDASEWGAVLQKINFYMPEAEINETWELEDKKSYDTNVFRKPKISAKYFTDYTTFSIPYSITDVQLRDAFSNPQAMDNFIAGMTINVQNRIRMDIDNMIMRAVCNAIAETVYDSFAGATTYANNSTVRAVNALYLYNANKAEADKLTPEKALENKDFLKFVSKKMNDYANNMQSMSTLFNAEDIERFTNEDNLHVAVLSSFATAAQYYLEADTWHNDMVKLPRYELVNYWQGSGLNFSTSDTSEINVKTASGHDVNITGVLAVMFDHNAIAVYDEAMKTTAHYVESAEFTNYWAKHRARYMNDLSENIVVFYIA